LSLHRLDLQNPKFRRKRSKPSKQACPQQRNLQKTRLRVASAASRFVMDQLAAGTRLTPLPIFHAPRTCMITSWKCIALRKMPALQSLQLHQAPACIGLSPRPLFQFATGLEKAS
jgi:hypothetical protein